MLDIVHPNLIVVNRLPHPSKYFVFLMHIIKVHIIKKSQLHNAAQTAADGSSIFFLAPRIPQSFGHLVCVDKAF